MVDLKQSIQYVKGVGPNRAKLFNILGIYTNRGFNKLLSKGVSG